MNKEKEDALNEAFERFMDMSFMKIPLDAATASESIDSDVYGWGTTVDEEISTFSGWEWIISRQREQAEEMKLKFHFDRQPRHRRISHKEDSALIIEFVHVTVSGAEFVNQFSFRLTVVLEYQEDNAWKVIHWHGSIPTDSENDTWHVNELKEKTERLEKEVQERTAELAAKNRDLEIEAAVEKVRNQALAMQSPDDIMSVLEVLNETISGLNLNDLSPFIWINEGEGWFSQYDISKIDSQGSITNLNFKLFAPKYPLCNRGFSKVAEGVPYFTESYKGKELVAIADEVCDIDKESGEFIHAAIREGHLPEYYQAVATFKRGAVGLDFNFPPPPEMEGILVKMADAIGLAYQRVEELQESLRQRKDAELEASVERVRSRAMGMQSSEDLAQVLESLHEEFQKLNLDGQFATGIMILKDQHTMDVLGIGYDAHNEQKASSEPMEINRFSQFRNLIQGWRTSQDYFVHYLSPEDVLLHGKELREDEKNAAYADVWENTIHEGTFKELWKVAAGFNEGLLGGDFTQEPNEWVKKVLTKMASAFGMAYQRFKELQLKEEQAQAIIAEKERLELALKQLQATQTQLIHAEKMASLGELTAGIAHEIQNPLNFVNNFSELSSELVDEMVEELEKVETEEAKAIGSDIKQNLEKINHHGKRADAIVKGMLAHSRTGKGEKELTDINQLADEYLRLSYHGLRAKDSSFNADYKTDFDPNLPKINVIPQDIGRVLLNLINNAFQACAPNKHASTGLSMTGLVTVSTKLIANSQQPIANSGHPELVEGQVLIAIEDNGPGIPDDIKDKIFQPFFTTKPTGQGTGLGLSMSYDIITKGHGGSITVTSTPEKGSTFTVSLPQGDA